MKMFSDCSGECCVCSAGASGAPCIAGHGDDDFSLASKEQIIDNLNKGRYPSSILHMKKTLKNVYGYDYDAEKPWARWIKLTRETIPPENEYILVTTEWSGKRETGYAIYKNGRFYTDVAYCGSSAEITATVTHWMPFPPPEQEE